MKDMSLSLWTLRLFDVFRRGMMSGTGAFARSLCNLQLNGPHCVRLSVMILSSYSFLRSSRCRPVPCQELVTSPMTLAVRAPPNPNHHHQELLTSLKGFLLLLFCRLWTLNFTSLRFILLHLTSFSSILP